MRENHNSITIGMIASQMCYENEQITGMLIRLILKCLSKGTAEEVNVYLDVMGYIININDSL